MTFAIAPNLAGALGVHDAFGNALTIEVGVLFEELPVVVRLKGRCARNWARTASRNSDGT